MTEIARKNGKISDKLVVMDVEVQLCYTCSSLAPTPPLTFMANSMTNVFSLTVVNKHIDIQLLRRLDSPPPVRHKMSHTESICVFVRMLAVREGLPHPRVCRFPRLKSHKSSSEVAKTCTFPHCVGPISGDLEGSVGLHVL